MNIFYIILAVYFIGLIGTALWMSVRYHKNYYMGDYSFNKDKKDATKPIFYSFVWFIYLPCEAVRIFGIWFVNLSEKKKRSDKETIEMLQKRISELEGCYRQTGN